MAKNSRKVYSTGQMSWIVFCKHYKLNLLNPSDRDLCRWIVFMAQTCSFRTTKVYLAGIRDLVLEQGGEWKPLRERFVVLRTLQGLKRETGAGVKRKQAITPAILRTMQKYLVPESVIDANSAVFKRVFAGLTPRCCGC